METRNVTVSFDVMGWSESDIIEFVMAHKWLNPGSLSDTVKVDPLSVYVESCDPIDEGGE